MIAVYCEARAGKINPSRLGAYEFRVKLVALNATNEGIIIHTVVFFFEYSFYCSRVFQGFSGD